MFGSSPFFLVILIVVSYEEGVALVEESRRVIVPRTAGAVALISGRANHWGRRPGMEGRHYTFGKRRVGRVCPDEGRSAVVERSRASVVGRECGHNGVIAGRKKSKWRGTGWGYIAVGLWYFAGATALAPASYPPDRHLPRVRKTASCTHCYFHKRLAFALLSYTRCSAACFALGASGTVVGCVVAEYISRIADCESISQAGQRRHPCSLASAVSVQTLGAVALAAIAFCTSLIHVVRHASCAELGKVSSVLWSVLRLSSVLRPPQFRACILRLTIVSQQAAFGRVHVGPFLLQAVYSSDKVGDKCLVIGNNKCFMLV